MVGLDGVEGKVEASADFVGSEGGVINVVKGVGRLCVRSPWKFVNYLPFSVDLQVSEAEGAGVWRDVKKLSCGESLLWEGGGNPNTEGLRLRVKFADNLSQFPGWSTGVHVREGAEQGTGWVKDESGVGLQLSFQCSDGGEEAARIVSLYVPFWVIDATGVRLEYQARAARRNAPAAELTGFDFIPGQNRSGAWGGGSARSAGLKSLLEGGLETSPSIGQTGGFPDRNIGFGVGEESGGAGEDCARRRFDVYMVGDADTKEIRVRYEREEEGETFRGVAGSRGSGTLPWSGAVGLSVGGGSGAQLDVMGRVRGQLSLCCAVVPAPRSLGGEVGVKLVCLVNRYTLINLMGREMEIAACERGGEEKVTGMSTTMPSGMGRRVPMHFNDLSRVRIRPTEYGWNWSGPFMLRRKRHDENAKEVVLRLVNDLNGNILIVTVELRGGDVFGGVDVLLSISEYPPFRIENHTFSPLRMHQAGNERGSSVGVVLLPYHSAAYAWDYPDSKKRSLVIETDEGRSGNEGEVGEGGRRVGDFRLDSLAPSSSLQATVHSGFSAQIIAEGPSRVLRLSDSGMMTKFIDGSRDKGAAAEGRGEGAGMRWELTANLRHGIGLSVIDSAPQELVFMKISNVAGRRVSDGKGGEEGQLELNGIGVDNQLWVTPYPALMRSDGFKVEWERDCRFRNSGVMSVSLVKSMSVTLMPVELKVDGGLVMRVADMLRVLGRGKEDAVVGRDDDIEPRDQILTNALGLRKFFGRRLTRREEAGKEGFRNSLSRSSLSSERLAGAVGGASGGSGGSGRALLVISAPQARRLAELQRRGFEERTAGEEMVRKEEGGGGGDGDVAFSDGGQAEGMRRKVYFERLTIEPINLSLR